MATINLHLATTAIETTWDTTKPNLFLGEWCRLYDRKHIWQYIDTLVATPYGISKIQKDSDQLEINKIKSELFPKICSLLNNLHEVQYPDRFWKILVGHWFDYHTKTIFNRFKTLEQCLNNYQISSITLINSKCFFCTVPITFENAIHNYGSQDWNEAIYGEIFQELSPPNIKISYAVSQLDSKKFNPINVNRFKGFLKLAWRYYRNLTSLLQNQESPFIIGSYLSRPNEKKLLKLFGLPSIPERSFEFKSKLQPDFDLRDKLSQNLPEPNQDKCSKFIAKLLFQQIPVCYLEDFDNLKSTVDRLPWPSNPKFIFTSNQFTTDEIFKMWVAQKTVTGTPYITGQHGNNYGTHRYMNPSIEEETADRFITWGWVENEHKDIPGFVLKLNGAQIQTYDPDGGLLLLELHSSLMVSTWDECAEFANYFAAQQQFVSKLDYAIKKHLSIRLHNDFSRLSWSELSRWHDFDESLIIDTGSIPLSTQIASSRLLIFSYDSTGILEALCQNIPTLAFWQNGFDHLRDSAVPHYQRLLEAKIIHNSPDSAAIFINSIWDDIDIWWQSESVQRARTEYCKKYANLSKNPATDLKSILDGL
jgi:putative transferase (TIGR04331 family)